MCISEYYGKDHARNRAASADLLRNSERFTALGRSRIPMLRSANHIGNEQRRDIYLLKRMSDSTCFVCGNISKGCTH